MSISADRIRGYTRRIQGGAKTLDGIAKSALAEALGGALDNIAIGVIIVAEQGRIVHANHAARRMLEDKTPVVSLGGFLAALRPQLTKELHHAIALAESDAPAIAPGGIGVPLMERGMQPATAYVMPLVSADLPARDEAQAVAAVFVTPANGVPPFEIGTVSRMFGLTPAEARLLQEFVDGASLAEAATTLGISEATARTHRNHIFLKTGVSRRTDLLVLVSRLVPPLHRPH
jgi:DNA-binding CsgD family transcriptional regulator